MILCHSSNLKKKQEQTIDRQRRCTERYRFSVHFLHSYGRIYGVVLRIAALLRNNTNIKSKFIFIIIKYFELSIFGFH